MKLREFDNFLNGLAEKPVSDDVKRIGNIIQKHLDALAPLGTAQGLRSKKIIELAQNEFTTAVSEITVTAEISRLNESSIKQLKSIVIESFRGFTQNEKFDLDASIVLLYGPNGTGKSSFFEALEYSLFGFVTEAEAKRFANTTDYLKNARTEKFVPPILLAINDLGETVNISPNDEMYRFCFVEKNRIDDFSRMAAKLPAQQSKL
jgi:DNA sulfur modification protein DndD